MKVYVSVSPHCPKCGSALILHGTWTEQLRPARRVCSVCAYEDAVPRIVAIDIPDLEGGS